MATATPPFGDPMRAQVEAAYGRSIPDATWEYLVDRRYIAEFTEGLCDMAAVVDEIRQLNRAAPAAVALDGRRIGLRDSSSVFDQIDTRMAGLAEAIAIRASDSSVVVQWRDQWLENGLVSENSVTSWIDATYARHRPKKWPRQPSPIDSTNAAGMFATWPHEHKSLSWVDWELRSARVWCVPPEGPLGQLADLADDLAAQWDWNPGLATNFVLMGETPARPGVRGVSRRSRHGFNQRYGEYHLSWVRASIDLEVSPEELSAWWRGMRAEAGMSGRRPIREKAVRLAVFAMGRDEDTTLREDMRDWNQTVRSDWHYSDWRNFRTAAAKAVSALNCPANETR